MKRKKDNQIKPPTEKLVPKGVSESDELHEVFFFNRNPV